MTLGFEIIARDGAARAGRLTTAHGAIDTPAFMPIGTAGTVKAMTPEGVAATGARIVLGNTYHLMLRPGAERIAALGGLHRFMNWPYAILTDSGGFQVMSLKALRKISEEGVAFRSHLDGSRHLLTPERSIEIQHLLGADITMAFDECAPFPAEREAIEASVERTLRWAERSRAAFRRRPGHGIFGIVQGGVHPDLRARGGRIVAVGTTSLRLLESAAATSGTVAEFSGETRLFILPGYPFRAIDLLLTNFHLPRSTLVMLVAALAGLDRIKAAYAHAVARRYRFFSYGDACLIEAAPP